MDQERAQRVPRNTEREIRGDSSGTIAMAIVIGGEQELKILEAQGQCSFVRSETLPTNIKPEMKVALEKFGVKFGETVKGDALFQHVDLPEGWKKVSTDHQTWSKLVDEKGRERAQIFYKAAFYDRGAFLSVSYRYGIRIDYERLNNKGVCIAFVTDGDKTIHETEPISKEGKTNHETVNRTTAEAEAWLDAHFPNWRDPGDYWD